MDNLDFEWLKVDASYIKVHPHGAGARGGNQALESLPMLVPPFG